MLEAPFGEGLLRVSDLAEFSSSGLEVENMPFKIGGFLSQEIGDERSIFGFERIIVVPFDFAIYDFEGLFVDAEALIDGIDGGLSGVD
jgi:hypothetical protein